MRRSSLIVAFGLTLFAVLISCKQTSNSEKASPETPQTPTTPEVTSIEVETGDGYLPGASWTLVWADEFEGTTIDSANWTRQVLEPGHFNDEWQAYTDSPENAYIENGNLVIRANHRGKDHGMGQYTSARLHTGNKHAWKYGKMAARIKLPEGHGIWPAFWMLGANINEIGGDTPWPQSGEIDILELYGSKDDAVVEANIHYADTYDQHAMMGAIAYTLKEGKFADDFHVFELEWNSEKLTWMVDGEAYASAPITGDEFTEFHKEFYILLNLAVGGTYAGRPDETTSFPQHMYVDWVRVYQQ
ncbi:glycoside hydrolase family 16 protein [Robertkochia sediminum]|uniref:glycoside hydrolase family 16 protein n=1 Tax=Robertkochia sediminum TaxID=2785326 RepID=UPI00193281DE|nr:glycoside hydrolase family 16 protein [Robertkochia sediminum]MBL7471199.1 glycoside hydrolase family 16 protein [Robertkochia sediminum]